MLDYIVSILGSSINTVSTFCFIYSNAFFISKYFKNWQHFNKYFKMYYIHAYTLLHPGTLPSNLCFNYWKSNKYDVQGETTYYLETKLLKVKTRYIQLRIVAFLNLCNNSNSLGIIPIVTICKMFINSTLYQAFTFYTVGSKFIPMLY